MGNLNFNDLTGQKFGKLTVQVRNKERTRDGRIQWDCVCECGGEKIVRADQLKGGTVATCGCVFEYHGMSHSSEYKIWDSMLQRCNNPKNSHYADYGGRGITVCDEWKTSFNAFYRDMGPKPAPRYSIDRRKNDEGYSKDNCHWVTQKEQTNNTRSNLVFTYKGETKNLMQWCEELGFNYHNVKYRIHKGMLFEVAIAVDKIEKNNLLTLGGVTKSILAWCKDSGVKFALFRYRLGKGWTFTEALTPIQDKPIPFDGEIKMLKDWCDLLGLDENSTYLGILRGASFKSLASK